MEMLGAGGLWLGLLIGIPAGMAVQHARHMVKSYRTTKASLPGQRKAASGAQTRAALWIVAVVGVVGMVLAVLAEAG